MTPEITTLLALLVGGLLLIAGGAYWWINRSPRVDREESEPLPLFGTLTPAERMRSPAGAQPVVRAAEPPRDRAPAVAPPVAPPDRPAPVIREFVTTSAPPTPPSPAAAPATPVPAAPVTVPVTAPDQAVMSEAGVPGTMVEGHALRFSVPAEGTLQFLPGRLEIGSGLDAGREIRFVRVEGPNGIEVTFGRADGELYRHIQLRDKTVSRAHAVMRFSEGTWRLQNLSHTNPVIHNGAQMAGESVCQLADGDRVEMGEVVFTFRAR